MAFTDKAKLTALAIVHVFETSKPFGDYSAVAVLNDGAGVSYGVSQFTHRAGSLRKVVNTYLGMGGKVGEAVLRDRMHVLMDTGPHAVRQLSHDQQFKDALRFAGETGEMKLAQNQIAENFYLLPSIEACEGSGFECPLSLAVVYDSINHGSFAKIRDRVPAHLPEKQWITTYVQKRDAWLESSAKLAATDYRTDFFLAQIARGNWDLDLPIYPHGTKITDDMIVIAQQEDSAAGPVIDEPASADLADAAMVPPRDAATTDPSNPTDPAQPPIQQQAVGFTAEKFTAYVPQIDTAKSWIKRSLSGTFLAAAAANYAGLPLWIQVSLGGVLVVIVIGTIVIFVKYYDKVFAFITEMNKLRADSSTHNPEISAEAPPTS